MSDERPTPRTTVDDAVSVNRAIAAVGLSRRNGDRGRFLSTWMPGAVAIGLVALVWQVLALHNPYYLPRIGAIWSTLVDDRAIYFAGTVRTLQETAVGLGASFVVAFSLAVAMCHVRVIDRAVMPLAVILNVTPIIAIAPGLAVAFGYHETPKYIVTAIIVFFPMLVNSLAGLRSIDPEAHDVLRSLNASKLDVLFRLRLPSSLPFLFAAARVAFPLAIVGAVVAEFVASSTGGGLGSIIEGNVSGGGGPQALANIYAGVFCLAVLGLLLTLVVALLEARLLSWHNSYRRPR